MPIILDACAIIAFLRNEPGAEVVENYLTDEMQICFIHVINLCEVYYDSLRNESQQKAQQILSDIREIGVIFRDDIDSDFWQSVAYYKATIRRISLADCFALQLTNKLQGTLLTCDHKEFDPIVPLGICSINFIR